MASKEDTAAMAQVLKDLSDAAIRNLSIPEFAWHVWVYPESGAPSYRQCPDPSSARDFLATYHGQNVDCNVSWGLACKLTPYPVTLLTHEGNFPLYEKDEGPTFSVTGHLGAPGVVVIPADALKPEDPQQEDDDEHDQDEDED